MDDKMICLWREAFKIFHFLSMKNISRRRDQNIFRYKMRNTKFHLKSKPISKKIRIKLDL